MGGGGGTARAEDGDRLPASLPSWPLGSLEKVMALPGGPTSSLKVSREEGAPPPPTPPPSGPPTRPSSKAAEEGENAGDGSCW